MKLMALKNGRPSNDYGWSQEDLMWAKKHPELHPDNFEYSDEYEQQRCKYMLALIKFLREHPEENKGKFRAEYDADLGKDVITTKWEGNTYDFYVSD